MLLNKEDSVVRLFLMEFRVRQRSDIRSASRIICCLCYLVHYLVGYYAVMIFILTF